MVVFNATRAVSAPILVSPPERDLGRAVVVTGRGILAQIPAGALGAVPQIIVPRVGLRRRQRAELGREALRRGVEVVAAAFHVRVVAFQRRHRADGGVVARSPSRILGAVGDVIVVVGADGTDGRVGAVEILAPGWYVGG